MPDLGFRWVVQKNGDVVVTHRGQTATTLRDGKAAEFREYADPAAPEDVQDDLARLTGNYKRGNERQAKSHPHNRR